MGENKSKEDSLLDNLNKAKDHNGCLINVIVVLTCIIIAMIAILCYKQKDFSDQISFASTITSIVLSVIAIIMTVVSGETLNNLLHKFRDLHDDIKDVPGKFEQTTDRFEKSCKEIEAVQKDLERLPGELISTRTQVEELSNELKNTHGDVINVSSKLDGLSNFEFKYDRTQTTKSITQETKVIPDELIDGLFYMPYKAVRILYVLFVAKETNMAFNMELIKSIDEEKRTPDYFIGIVSVLNGLGIIQTRTITLTELEIDYLSPYICSHVKDRLMNYFKSSPNRLKNFKEAGIESPEEFVERINKLFGYTE